MSRRPDFVVFNKTRDGKHSKRIGVAWSSKSKTNVPYVKVVLDFTPNDGELMLWPADEDQASPDQVYIRGGEDIPF